MPHKRHLVAIIISTCLLALLTLNGLPWKARGFSYPRLVRFDDNAKGPAVSESASETRQSVGQVIISTSPSCRLSSPTRKLVLPKVKRDDLSWITRHIPSIETQLYAADDMSAQNHPPKNKGHEVMVYLSYIIDNYETLADVTIFMHAHRYTHHNNELQSFDAVQMILDLDNNHILNNGYFNMRCSWSPGCPSWLVTNSTQEDMGKQEELVLVEAWHELFPGEPLPPILGQPCCAQFALSKAAILYHSKLRYVFFRDWILRSPLADYISGRIWEYTWQKLFSGNDTMCVPEHHCYCEGYGLCFKDSEDYGRAQSLRRELQVSESRHLFTPRSRRDGNQAKDVGQPPGINATNVRIIPSVAENELQARLKAARQRGSARQPKLPLCIPSHVADQSVSRQPRPVRRS